MDWRPYFCGVCFGIYPILMKRSELDSGASYLAFSVLGIAFALSFFAQTGIATLRTATTFQIVFIVASACASMIGLFWMFRYLADTPKDKAGILVIMMIVTQVVVTWIAALVMTKTMPNKNQLIGVVLASGAIYFLQR